MTRYRVTAPHVICRSEEAARLLPAWRHQKYAVSGYNRGRLLPEDAHPDDIERLLRKGLIEPVPA